jgi:lipopolysaccharide biosynthesis protein
MERNMQALRKFIEQKNHWNSFFNGEQYEIATAKGRQRVADMIDSCLSPENLTCDGELHRAEVNRRYRELTQAAKQLRTLDPTVKFYEYDEAI